MQNNQLTIAVIDDGVNEGFFNGFFIEENLEISSDLNVRERIDYNKYQISHGTICSAIIARYVDEHIGIISIKVLNNKSRGLCEQLLKAIDWCIKQNIAIVHLSIGTTDFRDFQKVRYMLNEAYKKGIILIAAYSNKEIYTLPASSPYTIGVRCAKSGDLASGLYIYNDYPLDGIEITASAEHHLESSRYPLEICNSYAAPLITARVYNILKENNLFSLEDIKRVLRERAVAVKGDFSDLDYNSSHQKNEVNINNKDALTKIPIIFIFANSDDYLLDIIRQLKIEFYEDDYNIMACSNNPSGSPLVIEYIESLNKLNKISEIYKPDLLIYGINSNKTKGRGVKQILKLIRPDINIVITDSSKHNKRELKIIIDEPFKNNEVYKVSYKDRPGLEEIRDLYQSIIALFDLWGEDND